MRRRGEHSVGGNNMELPKTSSASGSEIREGGRTCGVISPGGQRRLSKQRRSAQKRGRLTKQDVGALPIACGELGACATVMTTCTR